MIHYIALCNMCKLLLIAIIVIDLVIAMCYILVEVINMDNALLAAADAENALAGFETERAFLMGLQLGISMGRLDLLPEK